MKKYEVFFQCSLLLFFLCSSILFASAQEGLVPKVFQNESTGQNLEKDYYFPAGSRFVANIPTPSQFFNHQIGHSHTRYDQIVDYFKILEQRSGRIKIDTIGRTWEGRPLVVLKASSPDNIRNSEQIRQQHIETINKAKENRIVSNEAQPALVFLGFSVHGNETSAAEASILTAYYLAAAEDPAVAISLAKGIFFIDPVRNPDGYDRYVNWVNANAAFPPNGSPLDREHNEVWPGGRTNHYWFDLNRDWINQVNPESKARVSYFQHWLPHFQGDFHEMGAASSFFFEPTKTDAQESPLVPKSTYQLNQKFATYYAKALDEIGSFYFTKEQFDNINPTYGSTYPDHAGSLGILFEQASPRGLFQKTSNGDLTYPFAIRNHFRIALVSIKASIDHRKTLLENQLRFFLSAFELAQKDPVKGYLVDLKYNNNTAAHFKELLARHQIRYLTNNRDRKVDGKDFEKGTSIIIPTAQANYRLVKVIFDETKTYVDSVFYDGSGNSIAYLYGFSYASLKQGVDNGESDQSSAINPQAIALTRSNYAYLVDWRQEGAAWLLSQLLQRGILVKSASSPFELSDQGRTIGFDYGSLLIPIQGQPISADELFDLLQKLNKRGNITIASASTGYSGKGIDLGSSGFKGLAPQNALLLTGNGISAYEAGEVWYTFERQLEQPILRLNLDQFSRVNLEEYQVLVLASGEYTGLSSAAIERIRAWVKNGGTLIAFGRTGQWLAGQKIASFQFLDGRSDSVVPKEEKPTKTKERFDYASAQGREGTKRIGGTYFNTEIDRTHPIGYGYTQKTKPVYRNHTLFVELGDQAYNNVAIYSKSPLLNGYASAENQKNITGTASIIVENSGNGRIVYFVDDPLFRGISFGNARSFFNAVLLGQVLQSGIRR
ncbi:M14 family metallopeptidase [Sphingobacterium sp. ML3W]|uniref:M14 family metallopeptidase n=1 Tax=Sphingobacterium sp. ML3W TaxID=1538644 RepID=UPI00249CD131|nr:M14 family metallopeptidase [Sphingobacterium sp. ML3W]WFA80255.1 M14 family metallopeptidase [Sphingobacterium sp. ML3W]